MHPSYIPSRRRSHTVRRRMKDIVQVLRSFQRWQNPKRHRVITAAEIWGHNSMLWLIVVYAIFIMHRRTSPQCTLTTSLSADFWFLNSGVSVSSNHGPTPCWDLIALSATTLSNNKMLHVLHYKRSRMHGKWQLTVLLCYSTNKRHNYVKWNLSTALRKTFRSATDLI